MEFNHQTAEKPEQIRWSTDDQAGDVQVRSYACAFCKRGFSNAQALGGHMNIHRRDRAKLKLSSEENLLSLEISVKNSTDHNEPQPPVEEKILLKWDSGEDKNTNSQKNPNIFLDNINDHPPQIGKIVGAAEIQLPFLAGRRTSVMVERIEEKRIMELNHACSSKVEIDLELRLGPEPLQEASTLSTREFF